jgi:mono/diheme cytochrome c family protein
MVARLVSPRIFMLRFSCQTMSMMAAAALLMVGTGRCAADLPGGTAATPSHPIIPGFERFYAKVPAGSVKGGQLLLNELNCVSCHHPEAAQQANLLPKQAPVLDSVGSRVRRSYLRKFLTDPQAIKPGTAMPRLFADLPEKEREARIEALVHFLAATGVLKHEATDRKLISAGKEQYHKVGCVACHGTRDARGNALQVFATSVPLGDLKAKYSITSLKKFLENPHASRPSGRMPVLLNAKEAREVANYLLEGVAFGTPPANVTYAYYQGSWDRLPAFERLTPKATGKASGFDVTVARRVNNMALKFEGYLRIDRVGEYRFHLTSDDGSKLFIDDKLAVSNDGIHAPATQSGAVRLTKGMHKLMAGVFNAGGGVELQVDIEGPGLQRQDVTPFVFLTPEPMPVKTAKPPTKDDDDFPIDPALAARGRQEFATAGCANCHQLHEGKKPIGPKLVAPVLSKLPAKGGCLTGTAGKGLPFYSLSQAQRTALADALKTALPSARPGPAEEIARILTTFNCYACHQRDKVGGPESALNSFFKGAQQEMGDEGRLAPPLDGAGAKLKADYLRKILDKGAHDRPYMFTHMPGFGAANVGALVEAFAALDTVKPVPEVKFGETPGRVKADARKLVGALGLGCVKCHTFGGSKAEGLQGIDMTLMPQRLNHDWFRRYVADPQKFRPGTHMPAAWFNGKSQLPEILGGEADQQIEAIWSYLADGSSAQRPVGLGKQFLPLIPDKGALVYRNFIQGAGPRAIAVGYPEKGNLAFDANDLRLALIWQGGFIDASRHWNGRGEGFEPPLGDNILQFPLGPSFAVLDKGDEAWPAKSARDLGQHFRGYRLSTDGRPTFLYTINGVKVEDFPNAVASKSAASLRRELTLTAMQPAANLWFRAAVGNKIDSLGDGRYRINGAWTLRIESSATPRIRQSGGRTELLVPVQFQGDRTRIVEEFVW